MTKNMFIQLIIFISTILMILMFFFPNFTAVKRMILGRLDVITFLLVVGLYLKDLFKQTP